MVSYFKRGIQFVSLSWGGWNLNRLPCKVGLSRKKDGEGYPNNSYINVRHSYSGIICCSNGSVKLTWQSYWQLTKLVH